jgi:hypothetical protein
MTSPRIRHSYASVRRRVDALEAAECAESWLDELASQYLGHEGDHAVREALRNVHAVSSFLRRPRRQGERS